MTVPTGFGAATAAAIARARARTAAAIAAAAPRDVAVTWGDGAVRLTGRALSLRSLADPRLRDFAAIVRAEAPR